MKLIFNGHLLTLIFLSVIIISSTRVILVDISRGSPSPPIYGFEGGSGSNDDPFLISNSFQLQMMSYDIGAHYKLVSDIDAFETIHWSEGWGFEPVGNRTNPFTGSFDGQGYTISALNIDRPSSMDVGLFGAIGQDSSVTDLIMIGSQINGYGSVGGIIGRNIGGHVNNCSFNGNILGQDTTGGLTGVNRGYISDCTFSGNVSGDNDIGGCVGYNEGTIIHSSVSGNITGNDKVGGIAGRNQKGSVKECSFSGYSNGYMAGGIAGKCVGGLIEGCSADAVVTRDIEGPDYIENLGGVAGYADNSTISDCQIEGHIEGYGNIGGISGWTFETSIHDCSSYADVSGDGFIGGIAGYCLHSSISASHSFGNVNGSEIVGGLVGKNYRTPLKDCIVHGYVTGNGEVNDLVGENRYSSISNCSVVREHESSEITGSSEKDQTYVNIILISFCILFAAILVYGQIMPKNSIKMYEEKRK
jgi:hypothetical protein